MEQYSICILQKISLLFLSLSSAAEEGHFVPQSCLSSLPASLSKDITEQTWLFP